MTVQELQSETDFTPHWSAACPVDHGLGQARGGRQGVLAPATRPTKAGARKRPPTRSETRPGGEPGNAARVRPVGSPRGITVRPEGRAPLAPGRRVLTRQGPTARACHVEAPSRAGVVDDVPTWVLLACGILAGVLMLLAVALLGGPAYA